MLIVAKGNPWFPTLSNSLDSRKPRAQKKSPDQLSGTSRFSFWAGNSEATFNVFLTNGQRARQVMF